MGMKKIALDPKIAKAGELAEFATETLNLPGINHRIGAAAIIQKIVESGYEKDYFEIADEQDTLLDGVEVLKTEGEKNRHPMRPDEQWGAFRLSEDRRMAVVTIIQQQGPTGSQPIWLAVNGNGMWVPRAKRVAIPYEFFEVLRNAEEAQYDVDPKDNSLIYPPRLVPIYPYSVYHIDPPLGELVRVGSAGHDVEFSKAKAA